MKPLVIKVGGALLDTPQAMQNLISTLAQFKRTQQRQIVIVHGGGCIVDELMQRLNLPVQKKQGLRVTPADQIDIITGALAGIANKKLVAMAKTAGLIAVGLSLGDGNLTTATQLDAELGHVATVQPKQAALLNTLLKADFLPIISSIAIDDDGRLMNVNADQAATAIATLLQAELVMLSDVDGVLDQQKNLIAELNTAQIEKLIAEQVITDGMIVKVKAALTAAQALNQAVEIANWKKPEKLADLFSGQRIGTRIAP
ncbi:acetylglutamate kinase [Gallibacterium anatis]|uniref:Acetylglutamate kinase n=1 Tax=Gallibacterium anatis TaxID=750 RepID=A0AAX3XE59_9PAST|nr:acetylglutamate kinase [Gallibacterium anatis]MDK9430207.1 acetylglutamate kinase [Gallibacterium anatis]WIM79361.1 acetylglutamate kinase [Gallibacterium anatis]